jgi:sulfite exporter TauE/SafE
MSSINALLGAYLLTGLTVGFGHCIGMCGPLVITISINCPERRGTVVQLLYHCGRILTYAVLGGVMGATGSFAFVAANISTWQVAAMFFAGALMIAMGIAMAGWLPRIRIFGLDHQPGGVIPKVFKSLSKIRSIWIYLPIGVVLGFLPCGPVYTALLGSARAGMEAASISQGITSGMALMAAFGVGTVPALFLVAKLADLGWLKFRDKIYKMGALLMIGVGIYFIVSAIRY